VSTRGSVTVRDVLALLRRWNARLLAGETGLARPLTWASTMRARLPAFEGFQGNELALLSLATLRSLRAQLTELSLPAVVEQLAEIGVSAIAISGISDAPALPPDDAAALEAARGRADELGVALLGLPQGTPLAEVEREVIAHIVAHRERPSAWAEPADAYATQLRESLRSEALDAVLTGIYAGEAAMRARALQLGFDLTHPHVVLWVELEGAATAPAGSAMAARYSQVAADLAEALSTALGAWSRARDGHVAALLPAGRMERGTGEVVERVSTLLTRTLGDGSGPHDLPWAAGLGEPATAPAHVNRSATEARDAARLGLIVFGPRHVARPGDLGVYRLLLVLRDSGELAPFVARTLEPLLADTRTGDALVETLEAFFACNGNLSEAARHLHLHRNSLIYRLNRARELLDRDLDDPELRLALQLAIKGRRVLEL
jgi:sugar diacid utilization regulator